MVRQSSLTGLTLALALVSTAALPAAGFGGLGFAGATDTVGSASQQRRSEFLSV